MIGRPSELERCRPELVDPSHWRAACERERDNGGRFCGLHASGRPEGLHVVCAFAHAEGDRLLHARVDGGVIDTIVDLFPGAGQDEREAHDLFGVRFDGHEPLRALVAHPQELEAWAVPLHGADAYQVAVGPIHAGVIEAGHFRFGVVGERILHLDLRLFYKHRGLEAAAAGCTPAEGLRLAARACAACAVTNSVAYAQACEAALGLAADESMRRGRTLLLELERLYNHLNDVSAVCAGIGFAPGTMAFAALKERAQLINERLTGHRFLFGAVSFAASTLSIQPAVAKEIRDALAAIHGDEQSLWRELTFAASVQDRLAGVGAVSREDALRLGAVGPPARAAGVHHDTRTESPLLGYGDFAVQTRETGGDVQARVAVRHTEIGQTIEILDSLLAEGISAGSAAARTREESVAFGIARVESPRGETVCVTEQAGGLLTRLSLRTGSYANWPVLAHAVRENLLPDFPLINKSFELCYACVDR